MHNAGMAIFGATGGIGRALSLRLSERGARLFLSARSEAALSGLAGELGAGFLAGDVTVEGTVEAVLAAAEGYLGALEGVVLAVGSILLKPAHQTTDAEWRTTLALNLTSAFEVVRGATKRMPGGGSIVLLSSAAARIGIPNHEAIAAAKAGVIGLTLSAAATYASRNIRVNCVAPGLVRTPLAARITGNEASLKASTAMHPLGRIGEPEDVAAAIEFLLDPAHRWVTGQVLGVDGGLGSLRTRTGG